MPFILKSNMKYYVVFCKHYLPNKILSLDPNLLEKQKFKTYVLNNLRKYSLFEPLIGMELVILKRGVMKMKKMIKRLNFRKERWFN